MKLIIKTALLLAPLLLLSACLQEPSRSPVEPSSLPIPSSPGVIEEPQPSPPVQSAPQEIVPELSPELEPVPEPELPPAPEVSPKPIPTPPSAPDTPSTPETSSDQPPEAPAAPPSDVATEPVPEETPPPHPAAKKTLYILMYHHFIADDSSCNPWTLRIDRFREDLQWLADHGYTTILPSELVTGIELPEKAVMITFDDGYTSNYELAFPLLQEFQAKAVISLITSNVGPSFTWEMCREMAQSGLVEFGSHTHIAHNLYERGIGRLPNEEQADYQGRIFPDILTSVELIEQNIGTPVYLFAYPYGITDPWAHDFLRETFSVTVNSEARTGNPEKGFYDLPRYNISMNTPLSNYLAQ